MALPDILSPAIEFGSAEARRRTIADYREVDWNNPVELSELLSIFTDPRTMHHFISPPTRIEELTQYAKRPDIHLMVFLNAKGEMISTSTIEDSPENNISAVNSHEISRIAVRGDLQTPPIEGIQLFRPSVGLQTVVHTVHHFFKTQTSVGRPRQDSYVWITRGLPGWERMERVAIKAGFEHSMTGEQFVTKKWPHPETGDMEEQTYDASRYDFPRGRYKGLVAERYYDNILQPTI